MDNIIEWIEQTLNIGESAQYKIFYSLLAILTLVLLRWLLHRLVVHRIADHRIRYQWQKTLTYIVTFLGILIVGAIWLNAGQPLATYLGLVSAALVVALQDPITNFVGWGFILWRKPFEVGDRIQIGDNIGDVVDVRLFQFSMMEIGNWVAADQSTGRLLHVPNRQVFANVVANYTKGSDYIWNEIAVLVTFESNWKKAKSLLQIIADQNTMEIDESVKESFNQAAKKYYLKYGNLTPLVYTSVRDSGVLLTVRYLHEPRNRRDSEHKIWEAILATFAEHDDIDFAYPTQRFYNNLVEGRIN